MLSSICQASEFFFFWGGWLATLQVKIFWFPLDSQSHPNYTISTVKMAPLPKKYQSSFPVASFHNRARCFLRAPRGAAIGKCKQHITCLTLVVPWASWWGMELRYAPRSALSGKKNWVEKRRHGGESSLDLKIDLFISCFGYNSLMCYFWDVWSDP